MASRVRGLSVGARGPMGGEGGCEGEERNERESRGLCRDKHDFIFIF